MVFYTKTEKLLTEKLFRVEQNEIQYNINLPKLLLGRGEAEVARFVPVSKAPEFIREKFTSTVSQSIIQNIQLSQYENSVQLLTFESYFLSRLKELFKMNGQCHQVEGYVDFMPIYAQFDYLSSEKVVELSMLHALIVLIWRFTNDVNKMRFIYEHLNESNYGVDIPLTSFESFRKYIYRKRVETLPDGIIHGLYGKQSNNHELTSLMQDVLILLACNISTNKSAFSIKEDLDFVLETMPNASACGLYSISASKISSFMRTPASQNMLSFAKDNQTEFYRRVIGVMRFLRASAPLVRIYIDGYTFQMQYKNSKKKPDRLTGVFISDDFSDYIIAHEIGESENYEIVMRALEKYFKNTNNLLPREIVVDKYTYRILATNKAFIDLLDRNGIKKGKGLIVSSNPNRKSRLERFFNTFQQRFMTSIINYIGPSVKARRTHAHPFKEFLVYLQKNLMDDFDMKLVLNKLIKVHYNKDYVSPSQLNLVNTPESRFLNYDQNPLCKIDSKILPTLFYELHSVKVKAGSIMLRKGVNFKLYYLRDFDFINAYNGKRIDAYVKHDDPTKVYIYEMGTSNHVADVDLFQIIPVAAFDRTEEHYSILRSFTKQSRELIALFREEFEKKEETVVPALNGRDIKLYTKLARIKKEKSIEQDLVEEMNLKLPKEDPELFHSNKGRRRAKSRNPLEEAGIVITDTF